MATVDVVEYTDPTCSWAWGSEPKIRRLAWCFGTSADDEEPGSEARGGGASTTLTWRRVMGGLLEPGWPEGFGVSASDYFSNPVWLGRSARYHAVVTETTGMPFPGRLSRLPESSYAACRAVKAAERQGTDVAGRLLRRFREDWYVFGLPPGSPEEALESAAGVTGLDVDRLAADLDDEVTEAAWQADWEEAHNPHEGVLHLDDDRVGHGIARQQRGRMRYGYPTLILTGPGGEAVVPGWRPWAAYTEALTVAAGGALPPARPLPTPAEALAHFGLLAGPELTLLCGEDATPPPDAVPFDAGGGAVWMSPAEAATRRTAALT